MITDAMFRAWASAADELERAHARLAKARDVGNDALLAFATAALDEANRRYRATISDVSTRTIEAIGNAPSRGMASGAGGLILSKKGR